MQEPNAAPDTTLDNAAVFIVSNNQPTFTMGPSPTTDQELWGRLLAFQFDEPTISFPFSRRLAREHGWGQRHAMRVIEEYRRFIFLAMTARHPVTPSVAVDQAWHLHLTFTRSYWDELCANVLRGSLHHQPTKGGSREIAKFNDWYAQTLRAYKSAFGVAPPADIWPPPAIRFASGSRIRQVSDQTHWVIRKPNVGAIGLAAAVVLLGLVLTGCEGGSLWLILAFSLPVILIVGVMLVRKAQSSQTQQSNQQTTGDGGGYMMTGDTGGYWHSTTTTETSTDADASGSESESGGSWGSDSSSSDSSGGDSGCSGCGGD